MKLSVLIVDADREGAELLASRLSKRKLAETIFVAGDAREALRVFAQRPVELLLLDPILPEMDGVTLLLELLEGGFHPGVFVLSAFFSPELLRELDELGVAQCMSKPLDGKRLIGRLECWDPAKGTRLGGRHSGMRRRIRQLLLKLGMSGEISGFDACCYGIEWICLHGNMRGRITKELYPYIAQRMNESVQQVERNIRYAIECTWRDGNQALIEQYFGYSVDSQSGRPTNAAFLRTLAGHLIDERESAIV